MCHWVTGFTLPRAIKSLQFKINRPSILDDLHSMSKFSHEALHIDDSSTKM